MEKYWDSIKEDVGTPKDFATQSSELVRITRQWVRGF